MIERRYDVECIERIVNDPDYGPQWTFGQDLDEIFKLHPNMIVLAGEYGFMAAAPVGNNIYDVHAGVLPAARGAWAYAACQEALRYLFETVGADILLFRCPKGNVAALAGAKSIGAAYIADRMIIIEDFKILCSIYGMTRQRWLELTHRSN